MEKCATQVVTMECLVQAVAINVVGNVYKTFHAIQLLVIAIVDVIQDILMIFATKLVSVEHMDRIACVTVHLTAPMAYAITRTDIAFVFTE